MIIPDINLLIYAHNAAAREHEAARTWWEELMNGTTPVGLNWVILSGYIRLMTHPRVLIQPMTVDAAIAHINAWLDAPPVLTIEPGGRFRQAFLGFLSQIGTAGNLTTDAYLASLAIEHQAELHTNDTDFSRFAGLRWRNPIR